MNIRRACEKDRIAVESIWDYCFEKRTDPFFRWYFSDVCRLQQVLLAETAGGMAGCLHRRPYTLSVRGKTISADYLVGVAVHPAARGRGVAGKLLAGAFHAAREENKPAVILMPSDASLYYRHGFGFYVYQWQRTANPERLIQMGEVPAHAQTVDDPGQWEILAGIYEAYIAGRTGWAVRDESFWRLHIAGQLNEGYIAVVYDEKGPAGYLWYTVENRILQASEMAFRSESGRRGLYGFMGLHRGSVDRCVWYEPQDDDFWEYWEDVAEHQYVQNRTFPFMMGRITDAEAAFEGIPCVADLQGSVTVRIKDHAIPEHTKTLRVTAEGGLLSAAYSGGEADMTLTAEGAARLFFGAADADGLLRRGLAEWNPGACRESAFAFLEAALPKQKTWISEWY